MKKIYAALITLLVFSSSLFSQTETYPGNGHTGFGDQIGTGNLTIDYDGTNLNFVLHGGGGTFNNALVIYIDNGTGGGFDSTNYFTDVSSGLTAAISGRNGGVASDSAVLYFPPGFSPQYAIAIGQASDGFTPPAVVASLVNRGAFNIVATPSLNSNNDTFSIAVTPAQLGITTSPFSFHFAASLISSTGYRSDEAIGINITLPAGTVDPFNFGWSPYADTTAALLFTTSSLSVNLGTFKGFYDENATHLSWTTTTEVNTMGFNVQRSTDGLLWNDIGEVKAKNNISGDVYDFIDNNAFAGKYYYRLQIINADGSFTYSSVIVINKSNEHSVIILSNPVITGAINLNISDSQAESYQLSLYSPDGKLIMTQPFNQTPGTSNVKMIVPSGLQGLYFLRVSNGINNETFRILMQK